MATYDETTPGTMIPATSSPTHDNQIVAMFDTYAQARAARDKLAESGVASNEMDILDRNAETTDSSVSYERNSEGFWGALKGFFMPEEDSHTYAEGLERGHAMLVVRPRPAQREQVVTMLESFNPIDFDARESEWKQGGWNGAYAGAASASTTSSAVIPPVMPAMTTDAGMSTGTATAGMARTDMSSTGMSTTAATPAMSTATGDDKIQVLQENMRVGKREVGAGHIRIRSYVVERPVEEQVTLREEHVTMDRRPVDRPADVIGADAFRERTIDVTATSEEAVVAKDVRVVEEIGLRKDATERTETIKDTVRHTEVEVEDDTAKLAGTMPGTVKPTTTKPV